MGRARFKTVALVGHEHPCPGAAHKAGVDVDHCGVCLPDWGVVKSPCPGAGCPDCASAKPLVTYKKIVWLDAA